MKKTILLALTICIFANVFAQKTKAGNTTTFELNAATAKNLPEGVSFTNNKVLLLKGYKFVNIPNNGGVNVVNAKGTVSGSFICKCEVGGTGCQSSNDGSSITCGGSGCCIMTVIISSNKLNNQMKQN